MISKSRCAGVEINLHRAKTMVLGGKNGALQTIYVEAGRFFPYEKLAFDRYWHGVISATRYNF